MSIVPNKLPCWNIEGCWCIMLCRCMWLILRSGVPVWPPICTDSTAASATTRRRTPARRTLQAASRSQNMTQRYAIAVSKKKLDQGSTPGAAVAVPPLLRTSCTPQGHGLSFVCYYLLALTVWGDGMVAADHRMWYHHNHHYTFLQQVRGAYSTSLPRCHHGTHQTNLVCQQLWHTGKPGPVAAFKANSTSVHNVT
jgi:hypothetical protein